MKHAVLLLIAAGFSFSSLQGQALNSHTHQYQHKKTVVLYSFVAKRDSLFIVGHVQDKKTGLPLTGVNILDKNTRRGTVSNRVGELGYFSSSPGDFSLFLSRTQGEIRFYNFGDPVFDFEFSYAPLQNEIIEHSENTYSHH
ncbi:MAG: carboxypeptidase-like regulatory domain-containing protein [Cyclobacteriaceae bacterium]|nr:carboxypeptidase-like regulatory domain-containing protein [Cyclobacteriaceae bacterium]